MADCFVCGDPLYADQEWRLNPKYEPGTTSEGNDDEYGHKDCVEEVQGGDD